MASENNPAETSYQKFKSSKAKQTKTDNGVDPKVSDTDTAAKKLKERRKKFKFRDMLPKVEGLSPDQSEDLADAIGVFTGTGGDASGGASGSPSSPNLVSVANTIRARKDEKEATEKAQAQARVQAARDAKVDAFLEKALKA